MSFDPCDRPLRIWKSTRTLTPKVGVHSLTLSYTPGSMKCDSQVSLLACTLFSLCFGREPKARVVTP